MPPTTLAPIFNTFALTLYNPLTRPPAFLGLELCVLACAALTLSHALGQRRRTGDGTALFTWVTIFVYGLTMELASYRWVDNFWHGHFTVMLYGDQLPLYVVAIYPLLLYAGIATARRFGMAWWAEPFLAGLLIVATDVPFDIIGPVAGWWRWSDTDPVLAFRWAGVPVTSFYWHFAFGGLLAALTRWLGRRTLLLTPVAALATIVLGVVSFLPFHGLKALGVPDGTIVAALLASGFLVGAVARKAPIAGRDGALLAVPLIFYGYHAACALLLLGGGGNGTRLGGVVAVTLAALSVHALAHRRVMRAAQPAAPAV